MNGIVEQYNGVIVPGLCSMLTDLSGVVWPEVLSDVLCKIWEQTTNTENSNTVLPFFAILLSKLLLHFCNYILSQLIAPRSTVM